MKGFDKLGNMMSTMKKAKDMYSKMKNTEKVLEKKRIDFESDGVKVVLNGKQEVISIVLSDDVMQFKKSKLEGLLLKTFNLAIKKVQKEMEEETKELTGGLDMTKIMDMFNK